MLKSKCYAKKASTIDSHSLSTNSKHEKSITNLRFHGWLLLIFPSVRLMGQSVTANMLQPCPASIDQIRANPRSNQVHTAIFYVNTSGEVISRPLDPIDENDKVTVKVVGETTQLLSVKVERKSAFRDATSIQLLGASRGSGDQENINYDATCAVKQVELSDFAPGRGEVQITPINQGGTFKGGSFDFTVNPLYTGALSFGPVYSWLPDRGYGIGSNGQQEIITATSNKSPRIHYLITYTHFVWGKRDVEKNKTLRFYEHINPMIGLTLNDVLNNGFFGLSLDTFGNGIYLQGGLHVGKVTTLDPNSGLAVGSAFTGGVDKIPTLEEWKGDWFVGATIDLRAAIKFFSAASSGVGAIK